MSRGSTAGAAPQSGSAASSSKSGRKHPRVGPVAAGQSILALATLGLLVIPFTVIVLLAIPLAVVAAGISQGSATIQVIGFGIFVLHCVAIWSLTRIERRTKQHPDTLEVTKAGAPSLHHLINEMRERTKAPKIHRVILNTEMNASVTQTPRLFGLFGHRHQLTIGLPMLFALDSDEFAAVVAHELAHLRRDDSKDHALVYRVRERWLRIEQTVEHGEFLGRPLLHRFACWYRPLFEQRAADVLHAGELAADTVAAAAVGPTTVSRALVRAAIAQARLNELWSNYWLQNARIAKPAAGPWMTFHTALEHAVAWSRAKCELNRALNPQRSPDPTKASHPTLAHRLSELTSRPEDAIELPPALVRPATSLLGPFANNAIAHFDQCWWQQNGTRWQTFFVGIADQHTRLRELDAAANADVLTLDTALERASRAEYLVGRDAAIERYMWCLKRFPTEAAGYYLLGEFLISDGDERGIAHLVHAMSLDGNLNAGCDSSDCRLPDVCR